MSQLIFLFATLLFIPPVHSASKPADPSASAISIPELRFSQLFVAEGDHLRISDRLKSLQGKRVRMVGFMAQMEEEVKSGFYLCPQPVSCDEGGAGTGDLPLENLFVVVRSAQGKTLAQKRGALIVTGLLEVGMKTHEDGRVTAVRLFLDRPDKKPTLKFSPKSAKKSAKR